MNKYLRYLFYIFKHKYYVFLECCKLGIPLQGFVHDLSKFLPSEFFGYAFNFFEKEDVKNDASMYLFGKYGLFELIPWGEHPDDKFKISWMHHQRRNPHHWDYWVYRESAKLEFPIPIPEKYLKEMLADWRAMSRAFNNDPAEWYLKNKDKMLLREESRKWIEKQLGISPVS